GRLCPQVPTSSCTTLGVTDTGPQLSLAVTLVLAPGMLAGLQSRSWEPAVQPAMSGGAVQTQPAQFVSFPVLLQLASKVEARKWTLPVVDGPWAAYVFALLQG